MTLDSTIKSGLGMPLASGLDHNLRGSQKALVTLHAQAQALVQWFPWIIAAFAGGTHMSVRIRGGEEGMVALLATWWRSSDGQNNGGKASDRK
jgi:hypothetical protein